MWMPYLDAAVGGGTMTAYLGAVDHRVTAAVRGLSDQLYSKQPLVCLNRVAESSDGTSFLQAVACYFSTLGGVLSYEIS